MFFGMYSREEIESDQAGSQLFSTPDWTASNDDTIDTLSVGFRAPAVSDKFDIGFDYTYAETNGETEVDPGTFSEPFPDFVTRLNTARLFVDYSMSDQLLIKGGYQYEKFRSSDWALDRVEPDTIATVLTLGADAFSYDVSVFFLSFTYGMANE